MTIGHHASSLTLLMKDLEPYHELISYGYSKLADEATAFPARVQNARDTNRKLRIGVVGQVKAGKSSFLNALLFDGEELLPKAATPKTAALTIISHGEELQAAVEFYTADEWKQVTDGDAKYRQGLEKARDELLKAQEGGGAGRKPLTREELTDDYLVRIGRVEDVYIAAHELVEMVRKANIDPADYIDKPRKILDGISDAAELSRLLNDYVGANGRVTPLVKCSYLSYPSMMQDLEIVDTPGLNDPVLSRGRLTQKFLGTCDVAFLLSPAGQFLDQSDMNLLHEQFPDKGIETVVIVGSLFDLPLKGVSRKYRNIGELLDNLEASIRDNKYKMFQQRIENTVNPRMQKIYGKILAGFDEPAPGACPVRHPVFVSARAYAAARHFDCLNKEEQHSLEILNSLYPSCTFDRETLIEFSNMGDASPIRTALAWQRGEKDRILGEKLAGVLAGARDSFIKLRDELVREAETGAERVRSSDVSSLQAREKEISGRLKGGQEKIDLAFDEEISGIRKRLSLLLTEMKEISVNFARVEVKNESKVEYYTVSTSRWYKPWTWFSSDETRSHTVTYRYADAHEAISRVEEFVYEVERKLKDVIINELIDLPALKKAINEAVIRLFDLEDPNLVPENDILIPVRRAVARITVPEIDLGNHDYTGKITSNFSSGRVEESQINALRSSQKSAIAEVLQHLESVVRRESEKVVRQLDETRRTFTSDLIQGITAELVNLRNQLAEREATLRRFDEVQEILQSVAVN